MTQQALTRRRVLGLLAGAAGLGVFTTGAGVALRRATDRWERAQEDGASMTFPNWVTRTPRTREAYEAAYARLDLMATLPCYCGCGSFFPPHADLSECFRRPSGQLEEHASACTTCQDEALDAARWDREGVPWSEIHARIVAAYADVGPPTPGRQSYHIE